MTNEERQLIAQFIERVGGAAQGGFARSVPSTQQPLPPIDPEADRFIAEQFQTHPEARYRITQMAVVQEAALAEAANRIQRLQAQLEHAQEAARQAPPPPQPARGGFLGGLFGGGSAQPAASQPGPSVWNQGQAAPPQYAQPAPVPPPQYPPNMQPNMFQQPSGSGFLGGALRTAAGVAGGVVAGNVLMDLFSGHGGGGMFGGGGFGGIGGAAYGMPAPIEETTIINNYGDAGQPPADPGWDDNTAQGGGFDTGGGGWDDNTGGGGGFDDNSL
jgi:hypothetical protein